MGSATRLSYGSARSVTRILSSQLSVPALPQQSRQLSTASHSQEGLRQLLNVSEEVADALATNKPVVALESTIYTHGALSNTLVNEHDQLVRSHGAVPAIVGIHAGVPSVGLSPANVREMIETKGTVKVSRRDIARLVGMGLTGNKIHGGTTISGTMLLARLAGIRVFGTGGLGGVHRGGQDSMDISADLTELGRTRMAVISSGCKGFLDIPRTLEYLETQGCLVSTFSDGRSGKVDFPAFWARESGVPSPSVVHDEKEAAAMILAQESLDIESGLLFANPIPVEASIPAAEMQAHIEAAVQESVEKGFTGSANTPFILGRIKELVGDRAVTANKVLVHANIVRAAKIAVELSDMLSRGSRGSPYKHTTKSHSYPPTLTDQSAAPEAITRADILVAGSVALDLSCDFTSSSPANMVPQAHVSNPAAISQSIGGVGYNVALAAHRVNGQSSVRFCSLVGDDIAGSTILDAVASNGMDASSIKTIPQDASAPGRTAQYVAVNDGKKDLVLAMADMAIFDNHAFPEEWALSVEKLQPKWLVADGNWKRESLASWIQAGKSHGSKVAFEPVSAEKSQRLFPRFKSGSRPKLSLYPKPSVDLTSPNTYEMAAMFSTAKDNGYFDLPEWFEIIDALGMRGARDRFVRLTTPELTDAGIPVQSVNLLPYVPNIVTKLGAAGVLLTQLLSPDDPRLRDADAEEFLLARAPVGHPSVGGVYMRLFPAVEQIDDIVSVNGAGDTFLGVLISGLAQGGRLQDLIDVAQRGAVLSLKSTGSISPRLGELEGMLAKAVSRRQS